MGYLSVEDLRKILITNPFRANKLISTSLACLTQDGLHINKQPLGSKEVKTRTIPPKKKGCPIHQQNEIVAIMCGHQEVSPDP